MPEACIIKNIQYISISGKMGNDTDNCLMLVCETLVCKFHILEVVLLTSWTVNKGNKQNYGI